VLLDGIRVVSFCHYLQGPATTQYLADMGADVVKIEPPQAHMNAAGRAPRPTSPASAAFSYAPTATSAAWRSI